MPARAPGRRELVGGGGLGPWDPRTHPLLPHRSNIAPSRAAPLPGARCHQNHFAGRDSLWEKKKMCSRPSKAWPELPAPGGDPWFERRARRRPAEALNVAPNPLRGCQPGALWALGSA